MISFNKEHFFIVTGASSGIGEGISLLLNELGASVIGIARNKKKLDEMKSKCKYPENMNLENKDLTEDIEKLPEYIKSLKEKYGKFQGLVCCAGVTEIKPLQILDLTEMKKIFDINYFAPIFMAKGFADRRINNGKGSSIVFISSVSALKSDKGHTTYAGSKAALSASAKSIAKELTNSGIRVNSVSPSEIKTPMNDGREERADVYPFGFGEVDDVANLVIYLLSDKAKWITAQDYVIDCGCM